METLIIIISLFIELMILVQEIILDIEMLKKVINI